MSENVGSIYYDLKLDTRQFDAAIAQVSKTVSKIGDDLSQTGRKLTTHVSLPIIGLGTAILKSAADFEQTQVAFTTMLGDAKRARDLLKDISQFASRTPFTVGEVEEGAKQLLAMGGSAETLIEELRMLGDVSSGLKVPMSRLILNYGQVRLQNQLTGRELRDFAVSGVPLLDALSKQLGQSTERIMEMVSEGEIGFDKVQAAFKAMTGEGGKFNNLMAAQAKTTAGQFSNLRDRLSLMARDLGRDLLPIAIEFMKTLSGWAESFRRLDPSTQKLIMKLAAMLAVAGPLLFVTGKLVKTFGLLFGIFKSVAAITGVTKAITGVTAAASGAGTVLGGLSVGSVLPLVAAFSLLGFGAFKVWEGLHRLDEKTQTAAGSMNVLASAQDKVKNAQTQLDAATKEVEASQVRYKEATNRVTDAVNNQKVAQQQLDELNAGSTKPNIEELEVAQKRLSDATTSVYDAMWAEFQASLQVTDAISDQKLKTLELADAKRYLAGWQGKNVELAGRFADKLGGIGVASLQPQAELGGLSLKLDSLSTSFVNFGGKANQTLQTTRGDLQQSQLAVDEFNRRIQNAQTNLINLNKYVPPQNAAPLRVITGSRAAGGPVEAGRTYLVGERGAELFRPKSDGDIVSNKDMKRQQSVSTTIYGNITIGSQQDSDNFFKRLSRNQQLTTMGLVAGGSE